MSIYNQFTIFQKFVSLLDFVLHQRCTELLGYVGLQQMKEKKSPHNPFYLTNLIYKFYFGNFISNILFHGRLSTASRCHACLVGGANAGRRPPELARRGGIFRDKKIPPRVVGGPKNPAGGINPSIWHHCLQREARASECSLQRAREGTPPYPTCCYARHMMRAVSDVM